MASEPASDAASSDRVPGDAPFRPAHCVCEASCARLVLGERAIPEFDPQCSSLLVQQTSGFRVQTAAQPGRLARPDRVSTAPLTSLLGLHCALTV